jgi:hypothetical protein
MNFDFLTRESNCLIFWISWFQIGMYSMLHLTSNESGYTIELTSSPISHDKSVKRIIFKN